MKFPGTIAFGSCAKRLAGTLCLLVSPTALWAQQPAVDKEPKVEFVALPDLPLRWAGQKATIEDELSEVLLQNVGKQPITGFQLGWVLLIPEGWGRTGGGSSTKRGSSLAVL